MLDFFLPTATTYWPFVGIGICVLALIWSLRGLADVGVEAVSVEMIKKDIAREGHVKMALSDKTIRKLDTWGLLITIERDLPDGSYWCTIEEA